MQKAVKKRPVIDEHGYELSKKVMKKLTEKEDSV
jgi:translation initiation factor IF-3